MTGNDDDLRAEVARLRQLVEAMLSDRTMLVKEATRLGHPLQRVFVAKVNADGTWQERTNISGTLVNYTDGRKNTATTGARVPKDLDPLHEILIEDRDGADMRYTRISVGGRFCVVADDGSGVAGTNKTTDCTLKYNIKTLDSATTLYTGITPIGPPRIAKLHYTAATLGFYYIYPAGTVNLFLLNEKPDGTTCS